MPLVLAGCVCQAAVRAAAQENPGLRIIYRSAVPGHPNCTQATSPLLHLSGPESERFLPSGTRPDYWGWWSIDFHRRWTDGMFRALGAAILEVWRPASQRPDMHPPFPDRLSHNIDCLHYCPSEAVYRTWALMLVNTFQTWDLLSPETKHGRIDFNQSSKFSLSPYDNAEPVPLDFMENHTNGLRKSTKRPPAANVTQRYSTEFTLEAPVQARGVREASK
mmetsp:Transcript_36855/g.107961  ORF Transcript_36855/g.107961 Transcript_36855/m.107961 type:complete len:220 (+) Transcript_36855:553-1212(+)